MAKRRTRKEKEKAKHPFLFSLGETSYTYHKQPKSEFVKKNSKITSKNEASKIKYGYFPENTEKNININQIKGDILRSIFLSSLIIILEIVIYLFWNSNLDASIKFPNLIKLP